MARRRPPKTEASAFSMVTSDGPWAVSPGLAPSPRSRGRGDLRLTSRMTASSKFLPGSRLAPSSPLGGRSMLPDDVERAAADGEELGPHVVGALKMTNTTIEPMRRRSALPVIIPCLAQHRRLERLVYVPSFLPRQLAQFGHHVRGPRGGTSERPKTGAVQGLRVPRD